VLFVDAVYGNDSTASIGGSAWLTIAAAITASSSGQTIWIMPGTYTLASGITLKDGTAMRGLNTQTVILQMNVTSSTTMITMGENCRLEDCTINLTFTGSVRCNSGDYIHLLLSYVSGSPPNAAHDITAQIDLF